jgi:hypothetical protein
VTILFKPKVQTINRPALGGSKKGLSISWRVLEAVKRRALQKRVYFRALQPLERAILDLTIRLRVTAKSRALLNIISTIVSKISNAIMSFTERLEVLGRPLAVRMAALASQWGNRDAFRWTSDLSYIRYLGLIAYSTKKLFMP